MDERKRNPPGAMRIGLIGLAVLAFALPAYSASRDDVPALLRKTAECMFAVLKTVPGAESPRMTISTSNGWAHPVLDYRPSEENRWEGPMGFGVQKPHDIDNGPYTFWGAVPGLMSEDDYKKGKKFDNHVTDEVVDRWQKQCGANVVVTIG
jgi:hypothetical protein